MQLIYVTEGWRTFRHKRPMTLIELAFALLALLATPGPTNTLLALAGAQRVRRPLMLPLVELAAYLATVVPLSIWGQHWLEATPMLRLIHNRYFVEAGVNNFKQIRFNFMYTF